MLWGQRRTKSKGVTATTNKVFVLYSILRETEVGSRPPCTGKEPREKLGNVAQGHTARKCRSWNLGQDQVSIRAKTFGKSRDFPEESQPGAQGVSTKPQEGKGVTEH